MLHFATVYKHKGRTLGIADLIIALGNFYYDPKHPAGFGSVAKIVKASKNRKRNVRRVADRSEHVPFTQAG